MEIQDTRWQPNKDQRAVLEALKAEADLEKTQSEFVKKFWTIGTPSLYAQIIGVLDGPRLNDKRELVLSYFDKVSDARRTELFAEIEMLLEEIPRQRAAALRIREIKIHKTTKLRAVETAVRECGEKFGPERLVVVLAPTGGGKTIIANYLADKFNARFVEVRDVWRDSKSGFVPLLDICRAVGLRVKKKSACNIAAIQDDLIKVCSDRKIVLCFDEGEHFGRAALNLLKLLLNKTRIVPVIFCVTGEFENWPDYWENEAAQIARRTHAMVELSVIEAADAAQFFPEKQFEKPKEALELLTKAASEFGHFSLINRVAGKLEGLECALLEDVKNALAAARRQMQREVRAAKV